MSFHPSVERHGSPFSPFALIIAGLCVVSCTPSDDAGASLASCEADASSLLQGANLLHARDAVNEHRASAPVPVDTLQRSIDVRSIQLDDQYQTTLQNISSGHSILLQSAADVLRGAADGLLRLVPRDLEARDRWTICAMMGLTGVAFCLEYFQFQALAVVVLVTLWATSSLAMQIVNKLALAVLPLPMTLLIAQMLIADVLLLLCFGPSRLLHEIRQHPHECLRWSVLTVFFACGLITSIMALGTGSVTTITVVRNLLPLVSLIVERQILPAHSTRVVTWKAVIALAVLAGGTALYAVADLQISGAWKPLVYIFLNMFAMVTYRLAERRMLIDMPRSLSFGTLTLLQNVSGLVLVVIFFFAWGEHRAPWEHPELYMGERWRDPMSVVCIIFSGCCGVTLGYFSVKLQKEITATSFLVLQSAMKVLTILVAMLVLSEHMGLLTASGCVISLAGVAWYGFIVNGEDAQAKLAKELQGHPAKGEDAEANQDPKLQGLADKG